MATAELMHLVRGDANAVVLLRLGCCGACADAAARLDRGGEQQGAQHGSPGRIARPAATAAPVRDRHADYPSAARAPWRRRSADRRRGGGRARDARPAAPPPRSRRRPRRSFAAAQPQKDDSVRVQRTKVELRPFRLEKFAIGQIAYNEDVSTIVLAPFAGRVSALAGRAGRPGRAAARQPEIVAPQNDFLAAIAAAKASPSSPSTRRATRGSTRARRGH